MLQGVGVIWVGGWTADPPRSWGRSSSCSSHSSSLVAITRCRWSFGWRTETYRLHCALLGWYHLESYRWRMLNGRRMTSGADISAGALMVPADSRVRVLGQRNGAVWRVTTCEKRNDPSR